MLDVPDFQNPVGVESVDSSTCLIADHVDDLIVLERRPSPQVHRLEASYSGDIVLVQLVAIVKHHHLAEGIHVRETLWQNSLDAELEFLEHWEQVLGHRPVLEPFLDGSAHLERFSIAECRLDAMFQDGLPQKLAHFLPGLQHFVTDFAAFVWPDDCGHLCLEVGGPGGFLHLLLLFGLSFLAFGGLDKLPWVIAR